jgi:hypothetical protein
MGRAETANETPRPRSDSHEAHSMGHLDHVLTHMRLAQRDASTMFQLARGSLYRTLRLLRNLQLARPWVGPVDPPHSPTLRQKSEHLMQLPTTSYPYGYNNNRHGGSTGVKSHFLLPILGWAVKTYHCTRHTRHYSVTDHPRGRIRRVLYPATPGTRPYPFTIDPPRPVPDPASTNRRSKQESKACMTQDPESFHRLILYVTMVSGDGRPFSGYVATAASIAFDKTSPLRHPWHPCLLLTL